MFLRYGEHTYSQQILRSRTQRARSLARVNANKPITSAESYTLFVCIHTPALPPALLPLFSLGHGNDVRDIRKAVIERAALLTRSDSSASPGKRRRRRRRNDSAPVHPSPRCAARGRSDRISRFRVIVIHDPPARGGISQYAIDYYTPTAHPQSLKPPKISSCSPRVLDLRFDGSRVSHPLAK